MCGSRDKSRPGRPREFRDGTLRKVKAVRAHLAREVDGEAAVDLDAHRGAVAFGEFLAQQRGHPVAAQGAAHRGVRAYAGDDLVFFF